MNKFTSSNKGVSLIEIIVTLPLAALVFVVISLAMIHFITTYQEAKLYTQLQEDLFAAVETMRQGYAVDDYTKGKGLIGISSANSIALSNTSNSLRIYPALAQDDQSIANYWSNFSCDDDGHLWVKSSHGLNNAFKEPVRFFPTTSPQMIDYEPQFTILNKDSIWSIEKVDGSNKPVLLKITLNARVRFRERESSQSTEEDLRQNTKTIKYETSVFIGNSQA